MNNLDASSRGPAFSPFDRHGWSLGGRIAAIAVGASALAGASYISVPMVPVPVTMQTFAVTLIGALYGWRLGSLTVIAWLAAGALGLPVLAGGTAGASRFLGPTAGYLFAFPIAAALVGWLAERGWNGQRIGLAFGNMLLGNAVCLVLGAAWLGATIGAEKAVMRGFVPFLIGAVLKSALGAATLALLSRRNRPGK